jgi:hypothetical protein
MMNAEQLAQFFHETYTRLAPEYDRKPHLDPKPWAAVPEPNKSLLIAVAREMLFTLYGEGFIKWQKQSEYLVEAGIQAAEQARICACGHAVSEHMNLPASDGTPLLMCVASSSCGDTETVDGFIKRCSIPTEVTG